MVLSCTESFTANNICPTAISCVLSSFPVQTLKSCTKTWVQWLSVACLWYSSIHLFSNRLHHTILSLSSDCLLRNSRMSFGRTLLYFNLDVSCSIGDHAVLQRWHVVLRRIPEILRKTRILLWNRKSCNFSLACIWLLGLLLIAVQSINNTFDFEVRAIK